MRAKLRSSVHPLCCFSWTVECRYTIPECLVKAGRNVLAVRIWDWYGGGGFYSPATDMTLRPVTGVKAFLYHPDCRTDFITGDDPFRATSAGETRPGNRKTWWPPWYARWVVLRRRALTI